jgi:hypothetical protein
MECKELIVDTLYNLTSIQFEELKTMLVSEYIPFVVIKREEITPPILSEKIYDWIEKTQLQTGKSFEQLIENYVSVIDSVVEDRVGKAKKTKGKNSTTIVPRARKYYEKACSLKKSCTTTQAFVDYCRIMFCLYAAILVNDRKPIDNFNFSTDCLNLYEMLNSLRNEKATGLKRGSKFDTKEPYGHDRLTFILTVIMYYRIKSRDLAEE